MNTTNGAKMDEQAERLMREVRGFLEYARQVFPINRELADAFGAKAANKLARVVGMPAADGNCRAIEREGRRVATAKPAGKA